MSDKIKLKFLKQGSIEVDKPSNWDDMDNLDKEIWGEVVLNDISDEEIIKGLKDCAVPYRIGGTGRFTSFDELEVAMISDGDKVCADTEIWTLWHNGKSEFLRRNNNEGWN